jgi:transcription antitermination factor NusG
MFTEQWYALRVKPKHEQTTAALLRGKGYEEFVPVRRCRRAWSDRTKSIDEPLFPGYVFCRFRVDNRLPILTTPGVLYIVSAGKIPLPVLSDEIGALRRAVASGLDLEPVPYFKPGQRVRVTGGPLAGTHGTMLSTKNGNRLVLSVTLLQRSVCVEVDERSVAAAA